MKLTALDFWLAGASVLLAVCALATQSLAAIGLLVVAVIGTFVILKGDRLSLQKTLIRLAAGIALSLLILAGGTYFLSLHPVEHAVDSAQGDRLTFAFDTLRAISDHGFFGSGLGSFVDIYPAYQSIGTVSRTFVNHAHDDWLEFILEAGAPGAALLIAFATFVIYSAIGAFRQPASVSGLARAAAIGIGIVGMHSFVDYPIRTTAIAATFAMLCALMTFPPPSASPSSDSRAVRRS